MNRLMPHVNCQRRDTLGSRGFTLVEMLVAMTLMSLLILAMASALRTMAQTEQRVDQRLAEADEFRVATAFIEDVLGRVSDRKQRPAVNPDDSPFLFDATPDSVSWVGVMPARHGAGGRYFFRLAQENLAGDMALVIRFAPWTDAPSFPDWNQAEARALVRGLTSFTISYEGPVDGHDNWSQAWLQKDALPEHVRLTIGTSRGMWPLWVIATRPLSHGDTGRGGYSLGPG